MYTLHHEIKDLKSEILALKEYIAELEGKVLDLRGEIEELERDNRDFEQALDECGDGTTRHEIDAYHPDEYTLYEVLPPRIRDFQWAVDEVKRFAETLK